MTWLCTSDNTYFRQVQFCELDAETSVSVLFSVFVWFLYNVSYYERFLNINLWKRLKRKGVSTSLIIFSMKPRPTNWFAEHNISMFLCVPFSGWSLCTFHYWNGEGRSIRTIFSWQTQNKVHFVQFLFLQNGNSWLRTSKD